MLIILQIKVSKVTILIQFLPLIIKKETDSGNTFLNFSPVEKDEKITMVMCIYRDAVVDNLVYSALELKGKKWIIAIKNLEEIVDNLEENPQFGE